MYDRTIENQALTLRVSGKLWMRSLIMSDIETDTEWSHLLGRAMRGQLKGTTLKPLISDMATWADWKKNHPDTTVLAMSNTTRNYSKSVYRDPTAFVMGFILGGKPYDVSLADMLKNPIANLEVDEKNFLATFDSNAMVIRLFDTTINDTPLTFTVEGSRVEDHQTHSRWTMTGTAIEGDLAGTQLDQEVGIMSFRRAWKNFHPESRSLSPVSK